MEGSVHPRHVCCHSTIGKPQIQPSLGPNLWTTTWSEIGHHAACAGAHFHPPAVRELYITLPEEDVTLGMVGRLLRTLYGTRDAAHEWDDFANKKIAAVGYQVGLSSPCIYVHNAEPAIGWRHCDDILFDGEEKFVDGIFD